MFKTYDEFLINLVKRLDKNKNGYVEFEELIDGLKEFLLFFEKIINVDWDSI